MSRTYPLIRNTTWRGFLSKSNRDQSVTLVLFRVGTLKDCHVNHILPPAWGPRPYSIYSNEREGGSYSGIDWRQYSRQSPPLTAERHAMNGDWKAGVGNQSLTLGRFLWRKNHGCSEINPRALVAFSGRCSGDTGKAQAQSPTTPLSVKHTVTRHPPYGLVTSAADLLHRGQCVCSKAFVNEMRDVVFPPCWEALNSVRDTCWSLIGTWARWIATMIAGWKKVWQDSKFHLLIPQPGWVLITFPFSISWKRILDKTNLEYN